MVKASFLCLLIGTCLPLVSMVRKPTKAELIENISDIKDWKKLLKTRTNVLIAYANTERDLSSLRPILEEVADTMRGSAAIASVVCGADKKMCKKMLKTLPDNILLKHYKDGEFNKDYDRKETVKSIVNFLRDPTGDIPWDEDVTAGDVVHVENKQALDKLITKERKPTLIMFYAPWCGYCKKLKPDFAAAATDLKGQSILAGMNVDTPENQVVRTEYNITGFPTLYYFEQGKLKYKYGGDTARDGIIKWMRDPQPPKEAEKEPEWADEETGVVHLKDATFDEFLSTHSSVLVMFYAPWCGHCKKMKPEYAIAAQQLKDEGIDGVVAAVDATKEKVLNDRFKLKGFPTVKYFSNGKEQFEVNERTADKIVSFMKDPKEPPPPPPPEPSWEDTPSDVYHMTEDTMKPFLKKKKHALVMYYAPWCGHCKKAKPHYAAAALHYKDDLKIAYAAVDCTKMQSLCQEADVHGYPTFVYYNYGKNPQKYTGGREEPDFIAFMKDPTNPPPVAAPPSADPRDFWKELAGNEHVHHLTTQSFSVFVSQHAVVLVMFYAPWCGHCKSMKAAYAQAAADLAAERAVPVLAAVDATVERELAEKFNVKGFPTLQLFKNGQFSANYEGGRTASDILTYVKNAAPPQAQWADKASSVHHLTAATFDQWLPKRAHALVFFYTPWCNLCQEAQPHFDAAAQSLAKSTTHFLAAVDCTEHRDVCTAQKVTTFPTFFYYESGKFVNEYDGDNTKEQFVQHVQKGRVKQEL